MINPPIDIKTKDHTKNILPFIVWVLLIMAFSAGYFIGGTMQAIAYKNDLDKTTHYTGGK